MSRTFSVFSKKSDSKKQKVEETQQYDCPMCERKFQDTSFLHMHVATHFSDNKSPTQAATSSTTISSALPTTEATAIATATAKSPPQSTLPLGRPDGHETSVPTTQVVKPENKSTNSNNAFLVMMSTKQATTINTLHFSLNLIEGKLTPEFSFHTAGNLSVSVPPSPSSASGGNMMWSAAGIKLRKISPTFTHDDSNHENNPSSVYFQDFTTGQNVLTVTTNIPPSRTSSVTNTATTTTSTHSSRREYIKTASSLTLFKSMVQKAFRRRRVSPSIMLCAQLLQEHPEECLRRLPIILVEDGTLHAGLPVLVWLMIALTKGYTPPDALLATCLQIFAEAADCPVKDHLANLADVMRTPAVASSEDESANEKERCDRKSNIAEQNYVSEQVIAGGSCSGSGNVKRAVKNDDCFSLKSLCHAPATSALIGSLLLRMAYGGMAGDMRMLWQYAIRWSHRLVASRAGASASEGKRPGYQSREEDNATALYLHRSYVQQFRESLWGERLLAVSFLDYALPSEGSSLSAAPLSPGTVQSETNTQPPSSSSCQWRWLGKFVQKSCSDLQACLLVDESKSQDTLSLRNSTDEVCHTFFNTLPAFTPEYLVAEGIDFHCDGKMIDHILFTLKQSNGPGYSSWLQANSLCDNNKERICDAIKTTIWHFRSSINHRSVWIDSLSAEECADCEEHRRDILCTKGKLAGLWRLICPIIKEYCNARLLRMSH